MMIIKKGASGEYWVTCPMASQGNGSRWKASLRDWFLIKPGSVNVGVIHIGTIKFPKEMMGKKIRIKIELLENDKVRRSKS